jgi:cation diffusion facilitator family transporter
VADGKHLWTDVVTSVGVIIGIVLVWITHWQPLDPIVALLVGVNIIVTGAKLMSESIRALMDSTLSDDENATIAAILASRTTDEVTFHGLRTRIAGRTRFAVFDTLVPGAWTVTEGHDLVEEVEADLNAAFPGIDLHVHLEPREDPRAYNDFAVEIPIPSE